MSKESKASHYDEVKKAAAVAVKDLKRKAGEQSTVIVLIADNEGGWVCDWNWHHPLVALGLAKLGIDSIERVIKNPAPASPPPLSESGFKVLGDEK